MIPKLITMKQSKMNCLPYFLYAFLSFILIDQMARAEYEDMMHAFDMGWSRFPVHRLVIVLVCFLCVAGYIVQGIFKIVTPEPLMRMDKGALQFYIRHKKVPIRISLYRVKEAKILHKHNIRILQLPLDDEITFFPMKLIGGEIKDGEITLRFPKKERNRLEDIIELIEYRKEYSHQVECVKENIVFLLATLSNLRIDTLFPEMRRMNYILSLLDQDIVDWHQIKQVHKQLYLLNGGLPTHQLKHLDRHKKEELKRYFMRALERIEETLENVN